MSLKNGDFRVVYGEFCTRHADFPGGLSAADFVRSLLRRHPDWSIGDTWRDQIKVVEFVDVEGTLEPQDRGRYISQFIF